MAKKVTKRPTKKKVAKKTTTRKKAPPKKTSRKKAGASQDSAGARKPKWKVSAGASKKMTQRKSLFFKLPAGTTTLRILPPFDGSESLFTPTHLHYKFDNPDNSDRSIAPACLNEHGEGDCYLCKLMDLLKESGDDTLFEIGDNMYPNAQLNVQAFVWDKATKEWYGPVIVKLSKGVADELSDMLNVAEENDMPFFCDPDGGQGVAITKTGEGLRTKYNVTPTSKFEALDDIIPGWEKMVFRDMWKKLDVKVLDIDQQKQVAYETYPDWDWEWIEAEIG